VTLLSRLLAVAGLILVGWVMVTQGAAVVHGNPAYGILLAITVAGSFLIFWHNRNGGPSRGPLRFIAAIVLRVLMVGWLVALWWLRPLSAVEPAVAAMASDSKVTVSESATSVVMAPKGTLREPAILFQPGAKVEARAYAAVLRPLAEAGHRVVIVKQPLGIGFLAMGAFGDARDAFPDSKKWIVGGHSLGGTVASVQANDNDKQSGGSVIGLLLYASYPGTDLSKSLSADVLSISGTKDGLATPADIDASAKDLPADARFEAIDGAVHAFFGDYGPQPGDGQPTISHDDAREQIGDLSVAFAKGLGSS
jgi:hypothetical protein